MGALVLAPAGGKLPDLLFKVEFLPPRSGGFVTPASGEDHEPDASGIGWNNPIARLPEQRQFIVRQDPIPRPCRTWPGYSGHRRRLDEVVLDTPPEEAAEVHIQATGLRRGASTKDLAKQACNIRRRNIPHWPCGPAADSICGQRSTDFVCPTMR